MRTGDLHALDSGINFIDTADVYSRGESEEIVGQALKARRDDAVIATKCFNPMARERNHRGGSRRWILRAAEDSLRRLDTDYVDLFQVHRLDWRTALDETLGALSDLVHVGKVRYLGSSSYPAEWIVEAQRVASRQHRERFVCEQPQYSILARSTEIAVLPTCQRHDMVVIPWSPLAGGWLAGNTGATLPLRRAHATRLGALGCGDRTARRSTSRRTRASISSSSWRTWRRRPG
jgi:aryl-alcohol dehydrogenase (NADP+)